MTLQLPQSGTFGQAVLQHIAFTVWPALQDITGQWTLDCCDWGQWVESEFQLGPTAEKFVALPPGNYGLVEEWIDNSPFTVESATHLIGCDGIQNFGDQGGTTERPGVVFPVQQGYTTNITFQPALLELGVMAESGNAVKERSVIVDCQGVDISGQPIRINPSCDRDYESCHSWFWNSTDATGLASYLIAPGRYMVTVANINPGVGWWYGANLYDLQLEPTICNLNQARRDV